MKIQSIISHIGTIKHHINKLSNYSKATTLGLILSASPTTANPKATEPFLTKNSYLFQNNKIPQYIIDDIKPETYFPNLKELLLRDMNTGKFNNSLRVNKKSLMKDLHINSKKYDELCRYTEIVGDENGGLIPAEDPGCPSIFEPRNPFIPKGIEDFPMLKNMFDKQKNTVLDMEVFKDIQPTQEEKGLYVKYGINYEDENITPEKLAIGAIIRMNKLDRTYDDYVKKAMKNLPNMRNPEVQKSIKNAERILSDKDLSKNALLLLEMDNMFNRYNMQDNPFIINAGITKKDIKDLKIYASTIVLDKEAYILETWFNRAVLPVGRDKTKASANILNLIISK